MSDIQSESQHVRKGAEHGGIGRRRLLRAGLAATPVVLTVGSRSALAQGGCLSPSATASINLFHSRPDRPGDPLPVGSYASTLAERSQNPQQYIGEGYAVQQSIFWRISREYHRAGH